MTFENFIFLVFVFIAGFLNGCIFITIKNIQKTRKTTEKIKNAL